MIASTKTYGIEDSIEFEVEGQQFTGEVVGLEIEKQQDKTYTRSDVFSLFATMYGNTSAYQRTYEVDLTGLPYGYEGRASLTQESASATPYVTKLTIQPEKDEDF